MNTYKLNDTNVNEAMRRDAEQKVADGAKVFLVVGRVPTDPLDSAIEGKTHCLNCDGFGKLYLDVFVAGPYTDAANKKHVAWHEGSWYVHDAKEFYCPDCTGRGIFSRQAARPAELQL